MPRVFKSGAFAQQCFAAHPLALTFKRLSGAELLVLVCTSCRLQHHIAIRTLTSHVPAAAVAAGPPEDAEQSAEQWLARCGSLHPAALRVGRMDVLEEVLALRCADCRRLYTLEVAAFETHAP